MKIAQSRSDITPKAKALAVEDDRTSRLVLVGLLRFFGYETLEASSLAEAREEVAAHAPSIIVTDWNLPDGTGVELCRDVRSRAGRYTFVIVLTGRTSRTDLVEALGAGADDFLSKPFDRAELQARLRTADRVLALETNLAARIRELECTLTALKESQAREVQAQRLAAVGAVAISVKHEINNPLAGIGGAVDLALMDAASLPADTVESLRTIKAQVGVIARKIARIESLTADAGGQLRTTTYVGEAEMLDME